jgi:transposase
MRKLQIANAEIMRTAIQQEIACSGVSWYNHRLHGLRLVTAGQSCGQVGELFGEDRRTVEHWVKTFETHGLAGLREDEHPGRPRSLDATQWAALGKTLRRRPTKLDYEAGLWDGKLCSRHVREHYGVQLGVRQCQQFFRNMEFRFRIPDRKSSRLTRPTSRLLKKTCGVWSNKRSLSHGVWANATSSNTGPAIGCGCPRKRRIRWCAMRPHVNLSLALVRLACARANSFIPYPPHLMPKPSQPFSRSYYDIGRGATSWWSPWITLAIIMSGCLPRGCVSTAKISLCCSCHHTVHSSPPLSEPGSRRGYWA